MPWGTAVCGSVWRIPGQIPWNTCILLSSMRAAVQWNRAVRISGGFFLSSVRKCVSHSSSVAFSPAPQRRVFIPSSPGNASISMPESSASVGM